MSFLQKEKFFSREWFINYALIVSGSFLLALGFVLFINPYNIVPGGVYGVGIVVHHVFPFIPVGSFGLVMNIPLIIIGAKILGPRFGVKTIIGMTLSSLFMDTLTYFIGEGDILTLGEDLLLACIFGGVTIGLGLGLIFKAKATSAGSDIVAMILAKNSRLSVGQLLILVDSVIVILGLLVFKDWKVPLYSWIVIFVTGKVIDIVLSGISYDKSVFIISDKYEEIRLKILNDLHRGGTCIPSKGMYQNQDKKIIFTVLNRREVAIMEEFVHKIDPKAFLTVSDASEILGEGFKPLEQKIAENEA
ncbi:MAG: YitT family protein [Bacteroidota bacterium]|nr:YitT family protein [Bacteroidota bacterium]